MLRPIQTSGNKPPLFFVHGVHGVMPLGPTFARVLGADQPLYIINADGIDGKRPIIDNVPDMAMAYAAEIQQARPTGRVHVAGMCHGGLAAMEVVSRLQAQGREVGPLILADPPAVPRGVGKDFVGDPPPEVTRQLYDRAYQNLAAYFRLPYNDMPFDADEPEQMHLATLAGVGSMVALNRHVPRLFPGPVQLIVSGPRAAAFFHPEMTWHTVLPGPRMVHVLPWEHTDLFRAGREHVALALRFFLEEAAALETVGRSQTESDAPFIERFIRNLNELTAKHAIEPMAGRMS
jgi:thioesterase domain-containing protein